MTTAPAKSRRLGLGIAVVAGAALAAFLVARAGGAKHAAPPEARVFPHTTVGAQQAMGARDPVRALAIAEELLAQHPGDQRLLQVATLAACYLHDAAKAKQYAALVTAAFGRDGFIASCKALGVALP